MSSVLLFTKIPTLTPVKTRLISNSGLEKIFVDKLQTAFLADCISSLNKLDSSVFIYTYPECSKSKLEGIVLNQLDSPLTVSGKFIFKTQSELSFSERLEKCIYEVFKLEGGPVLVLGSDSPQITSVEINNYIKILDSGSSLLGPTPDGGLYAIGLSKTALEKSFRIAPLFSTPHLKEQTSFSEAFENSNLRYEVLEQKNDIDLAEDLAGLISWIESNKSTELEELKFTTQFINQSKLVTSYAF